MSAMPTESWVALLEDDKLVEVLLERPDQDRIIGGIFLGRVDAVLPGIQAAFVDIGTAKAGFLHVSDLIRDEDSEQENGGRDRRRRSRARKYPNPGSYPEGSNPPGPGNERGYQLKGSKGHSPNFSSRALSGLHATFEQCRRKPSYRRQSPANKAAPNGEEDTPT